MNWLKIFLKKFAFLIKKSVDKFFKFAIIYIESLKLYRKFKAIVEFHAIKKIAKKLDKNSKIYYTKMYRR